MAFLGDRYRLVERLGAGGMAVVWRAFDEVLGRQVAVKMLAGDHAADPDVRRAIRREARAVARLTHPNIGVVYDYGEWRDPAGVTTPYVVMELIDGPSLSDRLREGTLPWRAAVGVCAQIAAALGAAHARGLVHRDVKPANVMLSVAGVKVVDFGISALVGERVDQGDDGIVLGTPGYVAPERLTGAPVGAAADVYGLGVVLFKALVGRLPWPARDEAEMLAAHLTAQPEPLTSIAGMPDEVNELYLRCLAKDPGQRPEAVELARALGEAAGVAAAPIDALSGGFTQDPDGEPTTLLPAAGTAPLAIAGGAPPATAGSAAVPDRGATRPLSQRRRRRIAGLVLLPLALVAGILYLRTTEDHGRGQVPQAETDGPSCTVTYQVGSDNGSAFTGTLTLRARQTPPPDGWLLAFDLPAAQTFQAVKPAASTQDGDHVVVRLAASAMAGSAGPVVVPFTGSYRGTNPLPAAFSASGHPCTPVLLGPNGVAPPVAATQVATAGTAGSGGGTGPGTPGPAAAKPPAGPQTGPPAPPAHAPGPAPGGKPGKDKDKGKG